MRLDASQIEQRYGSPILLPSRPELLVLLAVGRAASAAPSGRHPELDALALHDEIKQEFCPGSQGLDGRPSRAQAPSCPGGRLSGTYRAASCQHAHSGAGQRHPAGW
jgi:hypothetical protein